jgi:hypothetical protein
MSVDTRPPSESETRRPEEQESPGRGRQIVVIFLVIALISIAVMQFHSLVPGMDQLVGVTPVVLAIVVVATIWLLLRTARRH